MIVDDVKVFSFVSCMENFFSMLAFALVLLVGKLLGKLEFALEF